MNRKLSRIFDYYFVYQQFFFFAQTNTELTECIQNGHTKTTQDYRHCWRLAQSKSFARKLKRQIILLSNTWLMSVLRICVSGCVIILTYVEL